MDKDFHFGTIYVLSRWAGFGSYNSLVIASASQFVDDNTDDIISNGKRSSGHKPWENLTDIEENNEVWIPFHFLPGLDGNSQDEKLICKKNSSLAQSMMNELPPVTVGDSVSMLRLGIALHVYADTWAHQEFSGKDLSLNEVKTLQVALATAVDKLEDATIRQSRILLGHISAIHWPDRPYIKWQCTPQFPNGRNNWDEFIDASHEIYKILTHISNGTSSDLDSNQENLLLDAFQSIQDENIKSRTQQWLDRIHSNDFGFTDLSNDDATVTYSTGFITHDKDFSTQFYAALDDHYNWIKNNLEANNINILD